MPVKPQSHHGTVGGTSSAPLPVRSVSMAVDEALENSRQLRKFASELLDCLKQNPEQEQEELESPCRSGMQGKLTDMIDNQQLTRSMLDELKDYLMG
jgi:hypothetical protein